MSTPFYPYVFWQQPIKAIDTIHIRDKTLLMQTCLQVTVFLKRNLFLSPASHPLLPPWAGAGAPTPVLIRALGWDYLPPI